MACQLEKAGEDVALLVLLDTVVPAHSQLKNYINAEAGKRDAEAQQFSLYRRLQHHLGKMSGLSLAGKFGYIFDKAFRRRKAEPASETAAPAQHPRGQKDYPVTLLRHRLQPYGGTVTLLIDEESSPLYGNLGWDKAPVARLETHILPGTHLTYIRENGASAAARLRALLIQSTSSLHHAPATA